MHGVPPDLDLAPIVGEITTQLRVGQFDLQFTIGPFDFRVVSLVVLKRAGNAVGSWDEGRWPDPVFYDVMNVPVRGWRLAGSRGIVIEFEQGLSLHLRDSSDHLESFLIEHLPTKELWVI